MGPAAAALLTDARRLSVAPMMDWTDRHARYFLRLIAPRSLLYTEMVTADAIVHGPRARLLAFDRDEHPVALQLGGSDPAKLAQAARIGAAFGYDEINLNCGCPSDRVQDGRFGACLMAEPATVAACVEAMRAAVDLPVTVKCRIGIDDQDDWPALKGFVDTVAAAGCTVFIVHARKAWLQGLSPKENREIPPLRYELVHRLKAERPDLTLVLNGGLRQPERDAGHLRTLDGLMIGREAYQNPYSLRAYERAVFATCTERDRHDVVHAMLPYIAARLDAGVPLKSITRHMLGLFNGEPGARRWRRYLSEQAHAPQAGTHTVLDALALVPARNSPERRFVEAAQFT